MIKTTLLTLFFVTVSARSQAQFFSHMTVEGSKLCIKSQTRTKCSSDDLSDEQQKEVREKIESIERLFPGHMIGKTLNHFWANHAQFSYSLLMSQFDKVSSYSCLQQVQNFNSQREQLNKKRQEILRLEKINEKNLINQCINTRAAQQMYKVFNPDFEALK